MFKKTLFAFIFLSILGIFLIFLNITPYTPRSVGTQEVKTDSILSVFGSKQPFLYRSIDFDTTKTTLEESATKGIHGETTLTEFLKERADIQDSTESITETVIPGGTTILKAYGNATGEIIVRNTDRNLDEISAFKKLIEDKENEEARATTQKIARQYVTISEKLLEFKPDFTVLNLHEGLVRAYKTTGVALETLIASKLLPEDFIRYNKSLPVFIEGYMNVALFLRANGVVFKEEEPGNLFTLSF